MSANPLGLGSLDHGAAPQDEATALAVSNITRIRPRGLDRAAAVPIEHTQVVEHRLSALRFKEIEFEIDERHGILFYFMKPAPRPCATIGVMDEIKLLQAVLREVYAERGRGEFPIRYLVLGSHVPGVFNLGGDLELFAKLIESRDRRMLEDYAKLSVDVIHANAMSLDLPIVTISLVQGDALGGGMEAAMCSNVIVAERQSKFGLPEILFGLFPGMGGYSFLARRVGVVMAERMIFSGKIYTAEELQALGVVDAVAEPGFGVDAVVNYCAANGYRHSVHRSIFRVRGIVNPLTHKEMHEIAMTWVEAALRLDAADIRKMRRLASAQTRRSDRASEAASERNAVH